LGQFPAHPKAAMMIIKALQQTAAAMAISWKSLPLAAPLQEVDHGFVVFSGYVSIS
jgi:hypothetical protein